jgi:hypothetical protein
MITIEINYEVFKDRMEVRKLQRWPQFDLAHL